MRFMKPVSRPLALVYGVALAMIAILGVVPWTLVDAEAQAADKAEPKEMTYRGRFVSFQDGELTIQAHSGALLENKIPTSAKVMVWNHEEGVYKPATTAQSLSRVEVGTWTVVNAADQNISVRIGARKGSTTGTFVSFKDGRLMILGKNLGESFTKKYGNNVHFHKFREDVPAHESIDGGEYKSIGTANKVLGDVKEGTVVTVHGEGDDNITLVQIGEPKKQ